MKFLIFFLSRACNFHCDYCFEAGTAFQFQPGNNKLLDFSLAKDSIDILLGNQQDRSKWIIFFFGGEPFLHIDLIKKIVKYAKRKYSQKIFYFIAATNGYYLKNSTIDFIKKNQIRLNISIDGEKKITNAYRGLKGINRDAYSGIVSTIKKLKGYPFISRAKMVVVPETVKYLFRSFQHLAKLGFSRISINTEIIKSRWRVCDWRELKNQLNQIFLFLLRNPQIKCNFYDPEENIDADYFQKLSHPSFLKNFIAKMKKRMEFNGKCLVQRYKSNPSFLIMPNGDLFGCDFCLFVESAKDYNRYKIGNLKDDYFRQQMVNRGAKFCINQFLKNLYKQGWRAQANRQPCCTGARVAANIQKVIDIFISSVLNCVKNVK